MIDPEFKKVWVAALRSGQYPQASNALRNECGFCCLGVACDLIDPTGWSQHEDDADFWDYVGLLGMMPEFIQERIGLGRVEAGQLALKNDRGDTFAEIADYIEEHL